MPITLPTGIYWPYGRSKTASGTSALLDATGEKVFVIGKLYLQGRASGAKTLDTTGSSAISINILTRTWSTSGSVIDIGVQGVDTSGPPVQPDGTFTVKRTLTQGTDTINIGVNSFVPSSGSASLSHGDTVAIGLEFTTRAGSDAVAPYTVANDFASSSMFPAGVHYTASWANTNILQAWLTFSDGTVGWIDGLIYYSENQVVQWNDSTNPDERGCMFQVPFDTQIDALWAALRVVTTSSDSVLTLYSDPLGTPTNIASATLPASLLGVVGSMGTVCWTLPALIALTANTWYVVALKATSGNNLRVEGPTLYDELFREAFPCGATNVEGVTRNNSSGAFGSRSETVLYPFGVRICEIPSGGGGGPAGFPLGRLVM